MTLFRQSPASPATRDQIWLDAQALISENFPANACDATIAPASQSVFGSSLGLRKNDVVTGILIRNATAAAGTSPTTARFGLADDAGVILARSGNVNTAAEWPAGAVKFALSAPYEITEDGLYVVCYVVNGTWGTTQPAPLRVAGSIAGNAAIAPSTVPLHFLWTLQTDLPAVGAPLTMPASSANVYMAVY